MQSPPKDRRKHAENTNKSQLVDCSFCMHCADCVNWFGWGFLSRPYLCSSLCIENILHFKWMRQHQQKIQRMIKKCIGILWFNFIWSQASLHLPMYAKSLCTQRIACMIYEAPRVFSASNNTIATATLRIRYTHITSHWHGSSANHRQIVRFPCIINSIAAEFYFQLWSHIWFAHSIRSRAKKLLSSENRLSH